MIFIFGREDEPEPKAQDIHSVAVEMDPLESWMDCVERVHRRLDKATEGDPRNYTEKICSTFLDNLDKDLIHDKTVRLGRLQKSAYRFENEVYTLVGVAKEHQRAVEVTREVNAVLSWVEEILCYAMVDTREVRERYVAKSFMYQTK